MLFGSGLLSNCYIEGDSHMVKNLWACKLALTAAVLVAGVFSANQANAFHHYYYSSGGSSGGWYSSGGCCGGYYYSSGGSSGGYYRVGHHHRTYYYSSGGCCGGYYSSGGCCGGWYSSGGCCGSYIVSYGSSGGCCGSYYTGNTVIYSTPATSVIQATPTPAAGPSPTPAAPAPGAPVPGPDKGAFFTPSSSGTLVVNVPADAKVYVNDFLTSTTGTVRQYVSRGLEAGRTYSYTIRVETVRDGQTNSETKTVQLSSGRVAEVAFNGNSNGTQVAGDAAKTKLTLRVPADAKVTLAGAETNTPGTVREYSTTKLSNGSQWSDYKVVVSVVRDGRMQAKEQTITLIGGENRELSFDFDSAQVASADVR